jgi:hypothetical protein
VEVTADMIGRAITGGEGSALAGASIKVVGKSKESKAGKSYTDFSYMRAASVSAPAEYSAQWNNATAPASTDDTKGDIPF